MTTARRAWWGLPWILCALIAALVATGFDAFLLQQKKAFFTGGFLAVVHTRSLAEAGEFLLASLLSDFSVAAVLAAFALTVASRVLLTAAARLAAVLLAAVCPLLIADALLYSLVAYLGDAFDLSLMFDLTGRSPAEIVAVAAGHLLPAVLLTAGAAGAALAAVWVVNRRGPARQRTAARIPLTIIGFAVAAFVVGGVATAVIRAQSEICDDGLQRKPSGRVLQWATQLATDFDRDGYGLGGRLRDPDPFNAAIYPYAVEIPGNGIDEDGVGGDLPASLPGYDEAVPALAWRQKPDVVLIVLESFRADAVGRVINGRPVTPVLDGLARQGAAAPLAFSHNGYTAQSRFHIFSGSLVGVAAHRTLVDDFKANGYEVAYFSGQDDSFGGPALSSGFERADVAYDARQDRDRRYTTFTTAGSLAVPHEVVQERVATFLDHRKPGRPLFLYVNFHDTHYPYHHHGIAPLVSTHVLDESGIVPLRGAGVKEMYYNTVANVDAAIGATLGLVARRLGHAPAVIVTGDHGESLFDEGFLGHGYALNDAQTHIPMIVAGLPLTIEQPFGQSDLRNAIDMALATSADTLPHVVTTPGKKVFQYLGNIDKPRQIAFDFGTARTIYDFRTGRVSTGDGSWQRPEELRDDSAAQFLELVHLWERMMVAKRAAAGPLQ